MSAPRIVVTGTDTDIGKTVFAAALTGALRASYWKPVQAGTDGQGRTDQDRVAALSGATPDRLLPEVYSLATPASPHYAAEVDGLEIDPARLAVPDCDGPLVIEGAGGVLVPLTRRWLYADQFAEWALPVVLVARTALGTINHTLLSIEALQARNVPILGIAFVGEGNADSEGVIAEISGVKRLGCLPPVDPLNAETLAAAFAANFRVEDFAA
ncbi:dethiobiotin synthase [Croceicoccus naphthovorans]|uniref:ATP-dependent dethiobiotin synthetase BioD n=1 Tax=Croceicoccus naphthovorans TaxID=1348774 RepID=A0A0G3XK23_9SPHN|nr:dethiobiotin synthase [Croceicoccus naphthovorans]AKM10723.1 dethiobiotin synthetase [Croceicoccus naphthovorans]MBB3991814.1 dethiobiotin synthetase [Croceicoccus naphthovorans]